MGAHTKSGTIKKGILGGAVGAMLLATPFVAKWEGLELAAYLDPVRVPTICYGSTEGVKLGQVKTQAECDALLAAELGVFMRGVDAAVKVPMPETRRAALTSFAYNVGLENFRRSTLLRLLNAGQTAAACNELRRWVYAKGIKLKGLVRRREAERELCLIGTGQGGQPI
jgi:lysozyme